MDEYLDFKELSRCEALDQDYAIDSIEKDGSFAIIAPHGGAIEPGTSELARALAGAKRSFYCFEGVKKRGNKILHITSENFDEPTGVALVRKSTIVIAFHGFEPCRELTHDVYLGGLNDGLRRKIFVGLRDHFSVVEDFVHFPGRKPKNICNRYARAGGVQLELSKRLRRAMFHSLSRKGRQHPKPLFYHFIKLIDQALDGESAEK